MIWTVIWLPNAEQELADLWLNADNRNEITQVSHEIDSILKQHPETAGESREDNFRIVFRKSFGVYYRVLPDDMRVEVVHFWKY